MTMFGNVPCHECNDHHVRDGDDGEDYGCQDDQVLVFDGSVPNKYPSKIEDKVDVQGCCDSWCQNLWVHVQSAKKYLLFITYFK